jgi:hypothetical protein
MPQPHLILIILCNASLRDWIPLQVHLHSCMHFDLRHAYRYRVRDGDGRDMPQLTCMSYYYYVCIFADTHSELTMNPSFAYLIVQPHFLIYVVVGNISFSINGAVSL